MNAALAQSRELPSIDSSTFKKAMRCLPGGVAVITSRHADRMNGMTATAVCSVSADPPLVLAVVNRSSRSHGLISGGEALAINVLSQDQEATATYFAGQSEKPFAKVGHRIGVTGCPLLDGCVLSLECSLYAAHDVGTHTLFIGRVVAADTAARDPLVYHNGSFNLLAKG